MIFYLKHSEDLITIFVNKQILKLSLKPKRNKITLLILLK